MSGQRSRASSAARRRTALLAGVALVLLGRGAFAQSAASASPAVGLAWSGPGPELTCLGEEGLASAVNEYVGRDAFAARSVELILHVTVERLPDRHFHALLELADTSGRVLGTRELTSGTELCSSLDEPLVLTVALMVDAPAEIEDVRAPPPPPPPVEPPSEPMDVATEPKPPSQPLRLLADAALAVESGLLPNVEPGLSLGLELRAATWFSARVGGLAFWPATVRLPGEASVRFGFAAATLELCPTIGSPDGARASLCIGPLYGFLRAKPAGLTGASDALRQTLALSVGLRGALPVQRRWALIAGLAGVVPYHPDHFVYEQNGASIELFRMAPFAVVASAGVSFMLF